MRRAVAALLLMAMGLVGCNHVSDPTYSTPQQAIEGRMQIPVRVYQEVPTDGGELLLITGQGYPDLMVVLAENAGGYRWRMWDGYDAGPLEEIGLVAFHQKTVGKVEVKNKDGPTAIYGKTFTMYGVVKDPRITWVEVTIPQKPDAPKRVPVVNGTWLVQWPSERGWPPYPKARLRAGDDTSVLLAVENAWDARVGPSGRP